MRIERFIPDLIKYGFKCTIHRKDLMEEVKGIIG
jgi:hypothetical protein